MADAAARLLGLIERLRRRYSGGSLCLVGHSDVIKAGLCRYRSAPFQQVHAFEIAPASVTSIAVDDDGCRVLAVNERTPWREAEAVQ